MRRFIRTLLLFTGIALLGGCAAHDNGVNGTAATQGRGVHDASEVNGAGASAAASGIPGPH